MNHLIPQPDALGVPSPPVVFQFLYILTFVLHLIFMNYVLGGMLIITIHEWIFGKNPNANLANRIMIRVMPVNLSLAITMGVAPLLFVQVLYGQFFYTANIMMGGYWLAIIALVTTAFYMIYIMIVKRPPDNQPNWITRFGTLFNSVLFLTVAFLFTNNAVLTENPQYWPAIYAKETNFIVDDATLWPRYLHNLFGAVAVAGLWCAAIGNYQRKRYPERNETGLWMIKNGLHWSAAATAFAIILGFVYLFAIGMGTERMSAFMKVGVHFIGWSISVMTAVFLIVFIVMAMLKPENSKLLWGAIGMSIVTLIGMVMGRDLLRIVSLQQHFTIQELQVRPSTSSFIMFVATFVIGLAVLGYMIHLAVKTPKEKPSDESGNFSESADQ